MSTDSIWFAGSSSDKGCKSRRRLRARDFSRFLCRVPRTRTSHASGSRLSRVDPPIFSLPLASLGPRKTIGTRPCPSDFSVQVLWLLTNPSQARGLGSSVRQRLMNLCCWLDETAANQALKLEANPSRWFTDSSKLAHPNNLAGSNST